MMSQIEYLHRLRQFELERALAFFPSVCDAARPVTVLEIGAGTGHQARLLAARGYSVTAIDLPTSDYHAERVYPVMDYDGRTLPATDGSVDVVYSSNVLEHVREIDTFLDETARVMKRGGLAIHILPTPAWRWWSLLSHYGWLAKKLFGVLAGSRADGARAAEATTPHKPRGLRAILGTLVPLRHGERGCTLTELYYFSEAWWHARFTARGFEIVAVAPAGLYYSEGALLGPRLSFAIRQRLSRIMGTTCRIYVLRKAGGPG